MDTTDEVTITGVTLVPTGDTGGIPNSTLLSMFAPNSGIVINDSSTTGTVNWNFDSDGEAFDYLADGENLVLTYTVAMA
ncbi:hypothetical protein GN156_29525, partial [bacterium LRH843]|nr:hypothetical protein [bacterium LRH843]